MSTAHTPGPWRVAFSDGSGESYITTASNQVIVCGAENCMGRPGGVRSPADARLIATAPELLAELQHVVFFYDQLKPEDLARAKAVIAKATGEGA